MKTKRLDLERLKATLAHGLGGILSAYSVEAKLSGGHYRPRECPRCGATTRDGVAINAKTGDWCHYGHERRVGGEEVGGECSGDILDLVAALEGLDRRRTWLPVLARARELARGVHVDPVQLAAHRVRRERERELVEHAADRERRRVAGDEWDQLSSSHSAGERYLRSQRRIDPALLPPDTVRYNAFGDICVRIRSFHDGGLITVTTRNIDPRDDEPKVRVPTGGDVIGSLIGSVTDIRTARLVVVTEGITDTLTAYVIWRDALTLGAHSAGQLPAVAKAAAPRVREHGGCLQIVPDRNATGLRCALAAARAAMKAGLVLGRSLLVVHPGDYPDLNAAHVDGWRP